jgi:hypothetical protein
MIGSLPVYTLAPLEYRLALDAAAVWLVGSTPVGLRCEQPALELECRSRLPANHPPPWRGLLWLEPQYPTWQPALDGLAAHLLPGARLALLLSLPPARRLPGFRLWGDDPLGIHPCGLRRLRQALADLDFTLQAARAFHGVPSLFWNTTSCLARLSFRRALADRLEFTARLHYLQPLERSWLSTCALLLIHRS